MTTTTQAHGGGARPASIDTSGYIAGGVAMRVYGFDSEAAAIAAGYFCEGGPAMSVALITNAQITSGAWRAEGDPSALVVYTAPAGLPVEGGLAVPVYSVNGWGSTPAPVAPMFSSAEVGTVNASTVAVTFDQDVSASDYSAGVTIKVNGSGATISSATRQANHAIVYYVLSAAVVFGDVVTWEYAQASGNIVAEDDGTSLANVTAQSVTNNVAFDPSIALRADAIAYWTMNEANGTRADATGHGYDLTAYNAPLGASGKVGNAVNLQRASAQYLGDTNFAGSSDLYVTFWVKLNSLVDQFFIHKFSAGDALEEFEVHYDSVNEIFSGAAWTTQGGVAIEGWSLNPVGTDTWHFIEFWIDTTLKRVNLAFNGGSFDLINVTNPDALVPGEVGLLKIGVDNFEFPQYADADIDEVGVWQRALTTDERIYLYNSGAGRALFPAP